MKKYLMLFLALSIVIYSCSNGEEPKITVNNLNSLGPYEKGIFIVNEGNYGESDGSISFIDTAGAISHGVFSSENGGVILGDVVQSMYIYDSLGFIVANNSNKVEVVNAYSMKSIYTITGLALPRYIISDGAKGFVSEWVSFTEPGRISVFDLHSGAILKQITTDFGAEVLLIRGNYLYVSNNFAGNISVLDLSSLEVIETITVGSSPGDLIEDSAGNIWVVCAGGFNSDWTPANNGSLVRINSVLETDHFEELGMNISSKGAISKDFLYFFSGTSTYKFDVNLITSEFSTLFTNSSAIDFYGIGVNQSGDIYMTDSKGFQTNGVVYVYTANGLLINEITVGRGPNSIIFRE